MLSSARTGSHVPQEAVHQAGIREADHGADELWDRGALPRRVCLLGSGRTGSMTVEITTATLGLEQGFVYLLEAQPG